MIGVSEEKYLEEYEKKDKKELAHCWLLTGCNYPLAFQRLTSLLL